MSNDDERDYEKTDREMYRKITYSGSVRDAIRAIVDYNWADEERDYLENCSDEPDDNQRAGHIYESLNQVRDWLDDERGTQEDSTYDLPDGRTVTRQGHRAAALQLVRDWAQTAAVSHDPDTVAVALTHAVLALSAPASPAPEPGGWRQRAVEAEAALTTIGSVTASDQGAVSRLIEIDRILRASGQQADQIIARYRPDGPS